MLLVPLSHRVAFPLLRGRKYAIAAFSVLRVTWFLIRDLGLDSVRQMK